MHLRFTNTTANLSQIVQLIIIADIMGPTPNEIADRLLSHVHKASELSKGIFTRNITKCIRSPVFAAQKNDDYPGLEGTRYRNVGSIFTVLDLWAGMEKAVILFQCTGVIV
jgi:hypothetical protein